MFYAVQFKFKTLLEQKLQSQITVERNSHKKPNFGGCWRKSWMKMLHPWKTVQFSDEMRWLLTVPCGSTVSNFENYHFRNYFTPPTFPFSGRRGCSKMPFIRTLRVNDERSTLRLHFVLMLTVISTRERFRAPSPGEHRIKIQDRERCGEKKASGWAFLLLSNVLVGVAWGWLRKILSQTPKRKLFLFSVSFSRTPAKVSTEIIQMLEITSLDFIPVMNTSQLKLSAMKFNHDLSFTED